MTKANKAQLLKIQTVFGGSIDYCKRNYRVNGAGVIVRTYYDTINIHRHSVKKFRPLSSNNRARFYRLLQCIFNHS